MGARRRWATPTGSSSTTATMRRSVARVSTRRTDDSTSPTSHSRRDSASALWSDQRSKSALASSGRASRTAIAPRTITFSSSVYSPEWPEMPRGGWLRSVRGFGHTTTVIRWDATGGGRFRVSERSGRGIARGEDRTRVFVGFGTVVNMATVLVGSAIGVLVGHRLPQRTRDVVTDALGLVTLMIAALAAIEVTRSELSDATSDSAPVLIVLGSLLLGGIAGSLLRVEYRLESLGGWLQRRF